MRKLLQRLLKRPLTWMADYMAASPKREQVFKSLTDLYNCSKEKNTGPVKVLYTDLLNCNIIIFSDQHKGNKSWADDFSISEKNYIGALNEYHARNFTFINLGDSEELWKFKIKEIIEANITSFASEAAFHPERYFRTFGNHDLLWKNRLDVELNLRKIFTMPLHIYEGIVLRDTSLQLDIFLTHGHQGDILSDNNSFSTWIVAHIWMPLQRYLRINVNSPSTDFSLRNKHNKLMYDWSSKINQLLLITGHTHQPIFASGKYYKHPSNNIPVDTVSTEIRPTYFNTGCCCYSDGDITGIELTEGKIRLIKWFNEEVKPEKMILEEIMLQTLIKDLNA